MVENTSGEPAPDMSQSDCAARIMHDGPLPNDPNGTLMYELAPIDMSTYLLRQKEQGFGTTANGQS